MKEKEGYKRLMTDLISKQTIILGPDIAIMRARGVKGLVVTEYGEVEKIEENYKETLHKLVDSYIQLSGQIVKAALGPIFSKYPSINVD